MREGLPYVIPAFCYFFNNNSSLYILSELDPATFSVSNLLFFHLSAVVRIVLLLHLNYLSDTSKQNPHTTVNLTYNTSSNMSRFFVKQPNAL